MGRNGHGRVVGLDRVGPVVKNFDEGHELGSHCMGLA